MAFIPKKHRTFLLGLFYILLASVIVYFILPEVIRWIMPFILAYITAFLMEPLVKLLTNKVRIPRKLSSILVMLIVVGILGGIIFLIVSRIITEVANIVDNFPMIRANTIEYLQYTIRSLDWLPAEAAESITEFVNNLGTIMYDLLQTLANLSLGYITKVPQGFIALLVYVVSTYIISSERDSLRKIFVDYCPDKIKKAVNYVKNSLFMALGAYVRAQCILMCITYVILMIWLLILQVDYAFFLSLGIALFDAIPILGAGGVLIPWAVFNAVTGNYVMAICLVLMYLMNLAMRQYLEPRLVSQKIGTHPLFTLMSIFIGLRIWGFVGVILGPAILIIGINLYKEGMFKKLLTYEDGE